MFFSTKWLGWIFIFEKSIKIKSAKKGRAKETVKV